MSEPMCAEQLEVVKVAHDGRHHCNGWQHDPERPTWNPITGGEGPLTGSCLTYRLAETALSLLGDQPTPEQPTHHTNDCDLLIRHRECSCGYAPNAEEDCEHCRHLNGSHAGGYCLDCHEVCP